MQTLAKIGGLIGLVKILSFFLAWYHRKIFERSYEKEPVLENEALNYTSVSGLPGENVDKFRDKFNFESFIQMT